MFLAPRSALAARIHDWLFGLEIEGERSIVAIVERLRSEGLLDLPRPGEGTSDHHDALIELGAADLSLARIAEGHDDARLIISEVGAQMHDGIYGVWAAEPPQARVKATRTEDGWRLSGTKKYASGARFIQRALVTAEADDGARLFDVALDAPGVSPIEGSWAAVGMADSGSVDVRFEDVHVSRAEAVGEPGQYVSRAGFVHGGVRVASVWAGGAVGAARMLIHRLSERADEHQLAHLGAIVVACRSMRDVLDVAAREIDLSPQVPVPSRARHVRSMVESACQTVLHHCGRASGSSALVFDRAHARRAADLVVYLRQHHAERDLAEIGKDALCSS